MPDLWSQSVGLQFSGVSGASVSAISASAPYHEPAAARMTVGVQCGGVPRTQKGPVVWLAPRVCVGTSETAGGGAIVRIGFLLIVTQSQSVVQGLFVYFLGSDRYSALPRIQIDPLSLNRRTRETTVAWSI